ncbi:MAG: hypothetical protein ACXACI_13560 [Candidatus Hodarchaeales archaeon]
MWKRKRFALAGLIIVFVLFLLMWTTILVPASANGDDDDEGFLIFGEDASKNLGLIAGPFFFLGGGYILFMWTRGLQRYLLVEWGDLIGLRSMDEGEVKAFQRKVKPWLQWLHFLGMGLAFSAAGVHAYGQYVDEGFFEGSWPHIAIWPVLLVLFLLILSGLDLKFRVLPNRIRRHIRPIHKNPILTIALAAIILGHVQFI